MSTFQQRVRWHEQYKDKIKAKKPNSKQNDLFMELKPWGSSERCSE